MGEYDTRAIESLDKLSEKISSLNSCSYTLKSIVSNETLQSEMLHDIYMRGPDKMYIHSVGTKGERSFWYNGSKFAYFSFDTGTYDTIAAPDNILKTIDVLNSDYNVEFPASDFFYPSLTDDILEQYNRVMFMGEEVIDNETYITIEASNKEETLVISMDKNTYLPHAMILESKTNKEDFYEATFANWQIDPNLPDLLFEFKPPANATRIPFASKKQ